MIHENAEVQLLGFISSLSSVLWECGFSEHTGGFRSGFCWDSLGTHRKFSSDLGDVYVPPVSGQRASASSRISEVWGSMWDGRGSIRGKPLDLPRQSRFELSVWYIHPYLHNNCLSSASYEFCRLCWLFSFGLYPPFHARYSPVGKTDVRPKLHRKMNSTEIN